LAVSAWQEALTVTLWTHHHVTLAPERQIARLASDVKAGVNMRLKPMIWTASIGLVALAVAPMLLDHLGGPGLAEPPQVLVTGSTHPVPPPAISSAGEGEAQPPEEAAPEDRLVSEEDSAVVSPVEGLPDEPPEPAADGDPEAPPSSAAAEEPKAPEAPEDLITIRRNGDRIEILGAIARVEERDVFIAAAEDGFPTLSIDTQLVQEANLPAGREEAVLLAISALSRLAEGRAEVAGSEITITGRALYAQTPELIAARLEDATPEGWSVSLDIDAPERVAANGGAQCQQQIVERLAEDQIGFASAAATINPEAEPLLDALAGILGECPDVAVEVAGHTDSDGSEAANRRLSQERAAAVRQALAERGVEAERLSAVGYGQAQPIAPNDTPENKARNRRIELIVIE
jgi:outer membrane protein OmpA-like peptidoglycan-associated protein